MAVMFPALFLGMAALVLNVLMTRMAEQQRVTVGTLKALGYFNVQLFDHYLKFGLFVGVLGGLFGCWLGYWISGAMTMMYHGFFEFPDLVNQAYPPTMAVMSKTMKRQRMADVMPTSLGTQTTHSGSRPDISRASISLKTFI